MNALALAIDGSLENMFSRDRIETIVAPIKAALKAAAQWSRSPALRPWCDTGAMWRDYLRLANQDGLTDQEKTYLSTLRRAFGADLLRAPLQPPLPATLLQLRQQFPNFATPVEFVAQQAALNQLRPEHGFQMPPLLLLGDPGIGKTRFAQELARCLTTPLVQVAMASQSNGWNLAGLDRSWGDAKPGQIFLALMNGNTMAPLVFLDEIDKAATESKSDPLGPLYQLLEPHSARHFRDEHVDFNIDACQVLWLATANDEHGIPPAWLSRFMVFRIPSPSGEELARIVGSSYQELTAGLPGAPEKMPAGWMNALRGQDLCSTRRVMQQAIGNGCIAGSHAACADAATIVFRSTRLAHMRVKIGFSP